MKVYHWDFFGPRAEATAEHFHRHLLQFIDKEGLVGCITGTSSAGAGHHEAWCQAPEEAGGILEAALRPRRATEPPKAPPGEGGAPPST